MLNIFRQWKAKWQAMKPVQRKFWTWYIVIKMIVGIIILVLFIVYVAVFKKNLWN